MKDLHHITTPEAARLLTSELGRRLMRPFMARECTLSDAAGELKMSLSAPSYHVKQLLEAGLIEVVREEKRKGAGRSISTTWHWCHWSPTTRAQQVRKKESIASIPTVTSP